MWLVFNGRASIFGTGGIVKWGVLLSGAVRFYWADLHFGFAWMRKVDRFCVSSTTAAAATATVAPKSTATTTNALTTTKMATTKAENENARDNNSAA